MLLLSCKSDNKTYAKKVYEEGKTNEMKVLLIMIDQRNMEGELTTTISMSVHVLGWCPGIAGTLVRSHHSSTALPDGRLAGTRGRS